MLAFVARLRGTAAERGTKDVSISLLDADGSDVIPPMNQSLLFDVKPMTLGGNLNLVVQLAGLQFKKYGPYAIHLVVQGNQMASVGFSVTKPPTTG